MKPLLPLLALLFCSLAQAYSGDELREDCKTADEFLVDSKAADAKQSLQSTRCISYLRGFADGYAVGDFLGTKVGVNLNAFCLPRDPELTLRLVRAVQRHLQHMPPNATVSTATLVAGALAKSFPCSN